MSFINIEGIDIHYRQSGSGRPLLLLHGWGCDLTIFEALRSHLQGDFTLWSIDFPGFGKSLPPAEAWGIYEYTAMLEKFTAALHIEEPILIGHSFGGRVSIVYASRNAVRKVILVDSAGIKPRRSLKYYLKVYSYKAAKKVAPLLLGRERAAKKMDAWRKKSASSDYNSAQGIMRQVLVRVVNEDLRREMPHITAPVLLIWGADDKATGVRDAQKMERLIKGSGLVVFEHAGHYSFLDQPFRFNAVVDSFLGEDKNQTNT